LPDLESSLARRLRDGDDTVVAEIFSHFKNYILKLSTYYFRSNQYSDDVCQRVAIKIIKLVGKFRFDCSLKTYIYRMTMSECCNVRMQNRAHRVSRHDQFEDDNHESDQITQEETLAYNRDVELLRIIIDNLPTMQKVVVSKVIYENKTLPEVSKELAANLETTKANYHHGIIRVKKLFLDYYDESLHTLSTLGLVKRIPFKKATIH